MHAALVKYRGVMARFNVDDKGTIMFAAFGPPPTDAATWAAYANTARPHVAATPAAEMFTWVPRPSWFGKITPTRSVTALSARPTMLNLGRPGATEH